MRTSRVGDKWSGHVAFPGGKREADDPDDRAAAARETAEEIGCWAGCEGEVARFVCDLSTLREHLK